MPVRSLIYGALLLALCSGTGAGQAAGDRPMYPLPPQPTTGIWIHARQNPTKRQTDPQELKRQADELEKLAASIPSDIEQLNQGLLSKELKNKLNRIQKLARQLRQELE